MPTDKGLMTINKDYWDNFYKGDLAKTLVDQSEFALFSLCILKFLFPNTWKTISLVDLGCGQGRDTNFFRAMEVNAYGIDLSCDNKKDYFKQADIIPINEIHDVYYLRFLLHSLEERDTDKLLKSILDVMPLHSFILIETRSSRGVTDKPKSKTSFKSGIGSKHFRMLYSYEYLIKKISNYFKVVYSVEADNLAVFNNKNPYIIRIVATNIENMDHSDIMGSYKMGND